MSGRPAAAPVLLAAVLLAGCTYTRAEVENPAPAPFVFRLWPYPTYDGDEKLAGHVTAGFRRAANRWPPPLTEGFTLDARAAGSGTRGVLLAWDAPARWKSWRFLVELGSERLQRAPYYGTGNGSVINDSLARANAEQPFYRYGLLRTGLLAAAQRNLAPHVRLHLAAQARHYRVRPLGDSTLLARDVASGALADTGSFGGLELRTGLLFDTRDEEASPTRGVFLEGLVARSLTSHRYTRYLASAREFVRLGEFDEWVLAFRQTTELGSGDLPFAIAYERLTSWYPEDGFGSPTTIRLYAPGRFLAPNRAVLSADVRRKVIDVPYPTSPFRVWVLAFLDAGRVWSRGATPSVRDLHWSAGLGGRIQISKGTLFGLDAGLTDKDGLGFTIGTSFAF